MFYSNRFSLSHSYNSLGRIGTLSDLTMKSLTSRNQGSKTSRPQKNQAHMLTNTETTLWLKKRYTKKAKAKYFLTPETQELNQIFNQVFGDSEKIITFQKIRDIFELCKVPLQANEVSELFFKNETDQIEKEFLTLKEFKSRFLSEAVEKRFANIMKKMRKEKSTKSEAFLPTSFKEVLDFLNYKLKRNRLEKTMYEAIDVKGKINGMKDLFSMKVEPRNAKLPDTGESLSHFSKIKRSPKKGVDLIPYKSAFFQQAEEEDMLEMNVFKQKIEREKLKVKEKINADMELKSSKYEKKQMVPLLEIDNKLPVVNLSSRSRRKKVLDVPQSIKTIMNFNIDSARNSYENKKASKILNFRYTATFFHDHEGKKKFESIFRPKNEKLYK